MASNGLTPESNQAENALSIENAIAGTSLASIVFPTDELAGRNLTGARAVIKINERIVGFAYNVNFRVNTQYDDIWAIDHYTPYELAPKRITVDGSMSMFHIPGKGATKTNYQASPFGFMYNKYIAIEITDSVTKQLILRTNKAFVTSRSTTIGADRPAEVILSWKAISWEDETKFTDDIPFGAGEGLLGEAGLLGIPGAVSGLVGGFF